MQANSKCVVTEGRGTVPLGALIVIIWPLSNKQKYLADMKTGGKQKRYIHFWSVTLLMQFHFVSEHIDLREEGLYAHQLSPCIVAATEYWCLFGI